MKPILVALIVGLSYVQQGSSEQYPGQGSHAHPPDAFICRHEPKPGEHPCSCKRMVAPDSLCHEEEPDVLGCSSYCFAKRHFVPDDSKPVDRIEGRRGTWHPSHCQCPIMTTDAQGKEVICGIPPPLSAVPHQGAH